MITHSNFTGRDHEALKGKLLSLVFEPENGEVFSKDLCETVYRFDPGEPLNQLWLWLDGEIPLPRFLEPRLDYAPPSPERNSKRCHGAPGQSADRADLERREAEKTDAALLWQALLRAAEVRRGIITETAALAMQSAQAATIQTPTDSLEPEIPMR